jgi:indole-3-glycerol phosphate synthase
MSILDDIVVLNRPLLEERKQLFPLEVVERMARSAPPTLPFGEALRGERVKIIAEIKKASPSRGIICENFNPAGIARVYRAGGAAAISVLTETLHFQGMPTHLMSVREALLGNSCPLLRKDFLWDEYQITESRAWGADAVLLIAALLTGPRLARLMNFARGLGLDALVEVHSERETEQALAAGARIIGINNRDLATFKVDLAVTERLRPLIPSATVLVSESGIRGKGDIERLRALGVDAALVGEALMAAPEISEALKDFV